MKYLKKFLTHSAYNNYISVPTATLPNVSYCKDLDDVHYNSATAKYNGHSYVEIDGIKWATMIIGSNDNLDEGLFFQWGDTNGYTRNESSLFYLLEYKYYDSHDGITKYNDTDEKYSLDNTDDAAQAMWGGCWRMPRLNEIESLIENTYIHHATRNGKTVVEIYTSDQHELLMVLPAARPIKQGSDDTNRNSDTLTLWCNTRDDYYEEKAFVCNLNGDSLSGFATRDRWDGCLILAVADDCIYNGHHYVDLGLPSGTLWATTNVGSYNDYDYYPGNYYMYGKGTTVYNSLDSIYTGVENPLGSSVDTATQSWGGAWHTPTKEQIEELINNTSFTFDNYDNIIITSQINGKKLYFKSTGYYDNEGQYDSSRRDIYMWSSTPYGNDHAYMLSYDLYSPECNTYPREGGLIIRPVIG